MSRCLLVSGLARKMVDVSSYGAAEIGVQTELVLMLKRAQQQSVDSRVFPLF